MFGGRLPHSVLHLSLRIRLQALMDQHGDERTEISINTFKFFFPNSFLYNDPRQLEKKKKFPCSPPLDEIMFYRKHYLVGQQQTARKPFGFYTRFFFFHIPFAIADTAAACGVTVAAEGFTCGSYAHAYNDDRGYCCDVKIPSALGCA